MSGKTRRAFLTSIGAIPLAGCTNIAAISNDDEPRPTLEVSSHDASSYLFELTAITDSESNPPSEKLRLVTYDSMPEIPDYYVLIRAGKQVEQVQYAVGERLFRMPLSTSEPASYEELIVIKGGELSDGKVRGGQVLDRIPITLKHEGGER